MTTATGTGASQQTTIAVPTGNNYDKYHSTNSVERLMMKGFMAALDSMLDGLAPARILEVGAGEGEVMVRLLDRFPGVPMVGVDLPDDTLESHWREAGLVGVVGDGTRLPFADDTFDLILAIEVLEHIPDPQRAVAELARVGNGTLVASVPFEPIWRVGNLLRRRYVRQLGNTPGHVNHWNRRSFASFVGAHFDVERVRSPIPWTMLRAGVTSTR